MRSRFLLIGATSLCVLGGATALAGPDVHVVGRAYIGPTEPPPPLRDEHVVPRAGFEWVSGRWDWRGRRWEWLPGRWEREHAGQHWHPGHWDHAANGYVWTEGAWGAGGVEVAPPPPPPPPGPPPGPPMPPPHEWHLDRPTVSSYWPTKGRVGTRVVIHGNNFPADAQIAWGPTAVMGAKVEPDKIVFDVPAGAQSATILIKRDHGHDLVVGNFEVADFDADAEAKALAAQRLAAAQASWAQSQAALARDQAARQAALDAQYQQREADREQRRAARLEALRQQWQAAFLADPDTQAELTLHAQRIAELARAKDLAGVTANSKLGIRIDVATQRENDRHDQRMAALKAAFDARGGAH
jgi:IPT/TIG domain/WXXGXW repeat (2 copies)